MIFLAADHNGNALAKELCKMINNSENLKLFFDNYENKPSLEIDFSINETQNELQNLDTKTQNKLQKTIENKLQNTVEKTVENNSKFEIKNELKNENKINSKISKNREFIKETKNKNTQIAQNLVTKIDPNDDYPDIAKLLVANLLGKLGKQVEKKMEMQNFGIAICGTGQGICMSLNRFGGIRAGVLNCVNGKNLDELLEITHFLRFHNNANILCFPSSSDSKIAFELIQKFVQTSFSTKERHTRRIKKLDD